MVPFLLTLKQFLLSFTQLVMHFIQFLVTLGISYVICGALVSIFITRDNHWLGYSNENFVNISLDSESQEVNYIKNHFYQKVVRYRKCEILIISRCKLYELFWEDLLNQILFANQRSNNRSRDKMNPKIKRQGYPI